MILIWPVLLIPILTATSSTTKQLYAKIVSELVGKELADYVNSKQKLFVAKNDEFTETMDFQGMEEQFAEPLTQSNEFVFDAEEVRSESLPKQFDARDKWPNCKSIGLIRNQASCGACWAFGAAEIMSDRICIQSEGAQQPVISVDDILSCCGSQCGSGCVGGYPIKALEWWNSNGVVTGEDYNGGGCKPYQFPPCAKPPCPIEETPTCSKKCQAGYKKSYKEDKYYGASAYKLPDSVTAIQAEIYHNGPVVASFKYYHDFHYYKSGIYHHVRKVPTEVRANTRVRFLAVFHSDARCSVF